MKRFKFLLGITLAITMIFSAIVPVMAESAKCDCGHTPVVSVSGINHVPLVDGNGNQVFAPSSNDIVKAVLNIVPALTKYMADSDTDDLGKQRAAASELLHKVTKEVRPMFDPIRCDENGNPVNKGVHIERFYPFSIDHNNYIVRKPGLVDELSRQLGQKIGGSHVYVFTYDWRNDLETLSDMLNEYIEMVKKQTKHDKVVLDGQSMGACLVQAYLAKYGTDSVETVAMFSGAYMGVDMVGELCKGNIQIDADGIVDILVQKMEGSADESSYLQILKYMPLLNDVIKRLSPVLRYSDVKKIAYTELLTPCFGFIPSLWGFVPIEDFDEAWDFMFADLKPTEEFKNKVEYYRNNVQFTMEDRVKELANSKDVKYYCISHYNRQMLPLTPDSHYNADGIIEANRTSAGATFAERGKTLPKNYIQKINNGYNAISPDRVVDASTCLVPDKTWIIKGLNHVEYNEESAPFFVWLLTSKEQYNIWSNPLYPQFMRYNYDVKYLSPNLNQYGDVNMDGKIDLVDARIALRYNKNLEKDFELIRVNFARADENGDKVISNKEVRNIMQTFSENK